jgi:hypothetical protein
MLVQPALFPHLLCRSVSELDANRDAPDWQARDEVSCGWRNGSVSFAACGPITLHRISTECALRRNRAAGRVVWLQGIRRSMSVNLHRRAKQGTLTGYGSRLRTSTGLGGSKDKGCRLRGKDEAQSKRLMAAGNKGREHSNPSHCK